MRGEEHGEEHDTMSMRTKMRSTQELAVILPV